MGNMLNLPSDVRERGQYVVELKRVMMTPKAESQLRELAPNLDAQTLTDVLTDKTAKRSKDYSPYFICNLDGLRITLCIQHNRTLESGRFVIVTIQELWDKGSKDA